jgi:hypothetical protein
VIRSFYIYTVDTEVHQKDMDPNTDEVDGMDETLIPVDYEKIWNDCA